MSKRRTVVSAGYAPLDIVLHEGRTRHAAGGTAGNVSAILAFLGWQSLLVGEVGEDPAGSALLADLRRAGVVTDHLIQAPGRTARVVHRTSRDGHSYEFSCPTCGVRFPRNRKLSVERAESLAEMLATPAVFFFDRANPGTLRLARRFAEAGSVVVFEPAFSIDTPFSRSAFELADIFKFSADSGVADVDSLPPGGEHQVQVATSGSAGAFYRVGSSPWSTSPAFSYPAVDEAGAGDWTTACLVHAVSSSGRSRADVRDALTWAQAIAAVSCGSVGARGLAHVRSRDSVLRSARRLRTSERNAKRSRPRSADELGLRRATASGVCRTCLEPRLPTAELPDVRWSSGSQTRRSARHA